MICYLRVQSREIIFAINNALAYAITDLKGCVGAGYSNHRAEAFVYDKIWYSLELHYNTNSVCSRLDIITQILSALRHYNST